MKLFTRFIAVTLNVMFVMLFVIPAMSRRLRIWYRMLFFSLWENLSQYDENKNIFLYLLIIVKNNCLNYLRSIKIKDSHGDKIVEAMLFSGVDDEGVDDDIRARLKQVLQELPDKGRFVLLEHIVEGKKVKDIALEMDVAESTVKTHLKRSLKYLREHLSFILFSV